MWKTNRDTAFIFQVLGTNESMETSDPERETREKNEESRSR